MSDEKNGEQTREVTRRDFLAATASVGAGALLAKSAMAQVTTSPAAVSKVGGPGDLNVALIGLGAQGRVLMDAMLKIPGLRFKAVCDIWNYSQTYGSRILKKYGHDVKVYADYKEMLAQEKGLDAAVVATPDWVHAEHAIACLKTGLHVYCEKEMSNSLEEARRMVVAARETGKKLQIGHQRRSNPRYRHAVNKIVHEARLLGRVTQANAQWNRAKSADLTWPAQYAIDQATLEKYGYDTMDRFRNWRWYKKYGGGPIVDLGSHQIDIFSWVFGSTPKSVMAGGGVDYYKNHEWYDNVMAVYEFDTAEGTNRAFYQVLTTTSNGGYFENFMGVEGTLVISENPKKTKVLREADAPDWDKWAKAGVLLKFEKPEPQGEALANVVVDVRESKELDAWGLPVELTKPYHQPHLENFFDAIRNGTPLNCPAETGYETAVMVLAVNKAVAAGKKIEFKKEDFIVA